MAKTIVAVLVFVLGGGGALVVKLIEDKPRATTQYRTETMELESIAELYISKSGMISTPSTVKWFEQKIIRHEGDWWAAYLEFDAQNEYGALIRHRVCAAAEIKGGMVRMSMLFRSVAEGCDPSNKAEMKMFYDVNGWGKPLTK